MGNKFPFPEKPYGIKYIWDVAGVGKIGRGESHLPTTHSHIMGKMGRLGVKLSR